MILQINKENIGTEPKTNKFHLCIFQCTYVYNNFLVMMTFRVIPVPIPNTEVKPKCAENTYGLPCWEDRLSLDFFFVYETIIRKDQKLVLEKDKKY